MAALQGRSGGAGHRSGGVLAVIGIGQLMVVLDMTVVNVALPSAQAELGFGTDSRQWVITAYSLAFGSLLLIGGRLSDRWGQRATLLIGLLGFAGASAAGGAASGFAMLVAARAAQGVFAAVLAPAALSTLNVTFTDPKARGRAFAVYSAVAASGAVVGLLLSGALTEWLSWRWCLYVNIAFAVPAAAGTLAFISAGARRSSVRLDWLGAFTGSSGLFCLVYGLSNAETHSWTAPLSTVMFTASASLLTAFVVSESLVSAALLPLRVLTDRNRAGSYLAIAFTFCSMFGGFLFLTYYMQEHLGYSPMKTGVAFLPLAAGIAVAAIAANTRLVPRFGPRPLVPTGMLIAAGGMLWLTQLSLTSTYAADVVGPLVLLGIGMGLAFSPSVATATTGVDATDAGVASAMVSTSQQIGGAIGTAALSAFFASAVTRYLGSHRPGVALRADAVIHGYTVAFAISCAIFLAGMVLTALLLHGGPLAVTSSEASAATAPAVSLGDPGRDAAARPAGGRHRRP